MDTPQDQNPPPATPEEVKVADIPATPAPDAPAALEPPKAPEPLPHTPILIGRHHDISSFASTDETRYVLGGIHYNPQGRFIEATNGRILIRVPVRVHNPEDGFPMTTAGHSVTDECIIPTDQFKEGLKLIPKKGKIAIMKYAKVTANGDNKAVIVSSTLDGEKAVTTKVIDGQFPNTEHVIPKEPAKFKICLAPQYLKLIADYANTHGHTKKSGITLEFDDELSPCRFSFFLDDPIGDDVKAYGVLMPMRLS